MKYLIISILSILGLSFTWSIYYSEVGKACYYSNKLIGRKTSSGEVFSQENLTAAHKSLKLGTFVKVTNLTNDSTVIVKVNDRLSKSSGHAIDLSMKAANKLNFVRFGSTKVKIESVSSVD